MRSRDIKISLRGKRNCRKPSALVISLRESVAGYCCGGIFDFLFTPVFIFYFRCEITRNRNKICKTIFGLHKDQTTPVEPKWSVVCLPGARTVFLSRTSGIIWNAFETLPNSAKIVKAFGLIIVTTLLLGFVYFRGEKFYRNFISVLIS